MDDPISLIKNDRIPPDLVEDFLWLQKCYRQSQAEHLRKTTAVGRLFGLIKEKCVAARVSPWQPLEDVWVWNESLVFEISRAKWTDVPGSCNWLAYLRKMYVIDSKRDVGVATNFIKQLQDWCDSSGAAVCLVSVPFGFSKPSYCGGAFFLNDVADLLALWESGDFHFLPVQGWLRNWYSQRGFRNAYLIDDEFFSCSKSLDYQDQFIYLPKNLDGSAKLSASHRIDYEGINESL